MNLGISLALGSVLQHVPSVVGSPAALTRQSDGALVKSSADGYFQSGHTWSIQAGGAGSAGNANDTSQFARGTQSLSFTTGTTTTAKTARVSGLSLDLRGKRLQVLLRCSNIPAVASSGINLDIFTGGAFTNGRRLNLIGSLSGQAERWIPTNRWTLCDVPLTGGHTSAIGSGPGDLSSITNMQLRTVGTGTDLTVWWNMVAVRTPPSIGSVVVAFDDCHESQILEAYPIMQAAGIPGTAYVITEDVGGAQRLTLANLNTLRDAGWAIAGHSFASSVHAANYEGSASAALIADIAAQRQWLFANGFDPDDFAYPKGEFWGGADGSDGTQLHDVLATLGDDTGSPLVTTCRTINEHFQSSWPPPEPMQLQTIYVTNADTPASVLTVLDDCLANKGTAIMVFHDIVDASASQATQYLTADFQTLMDGIATRVSGGTAAVRTIKTLRENPPA